VLGRVDREKKVMVHSRDPLRERWLHTARRASTTGQESSLRSL
jgi:hypothetical protein